MNQSRHAESRRVLVVDDDQLQAAMTAIVLRHAGYEVRTALSGRQALDDLCEHAARVVVLDLDMPDMSGAELLAVIRPDERLTATPVVIYSAGAGRASFAADAVPDVLVSKADGPAGLVSAVTRLT